MFRQLVLSASALALIAAFPGTALADHHEEAASGPALWQLSDEDTTIYLFGTIHVLPEGETWFDERISTAFNSADQLVFEINMDDVAGMQAQVAEMAMLPEGTTLRSLMTEENRTEYEAAISGLGLPPMVLDQLDAIEPWAAAMNLSLLPLLLTGWSPEQGVEMQLRAMGEDKFRSALETVEEQIGLFDTLPMEVQLEYLDSAVETLDEVVPSLDALKAEWLEGDADGLGVLMNEGMNDPEVYERLLVNRNRNWVGWIENRLEEPGVVFIAVGAGHLAGEGSVQELLAERGLMTERVTH